VYQILEVDDKWNILKCTLHRRRVQKISITLAILEEFLVISIFHEMKIPTVDVKVHMYSKFRKTKIWKKMKSLISMRNGRFNTSKCRGRASFKKWGYCTPILLAHSPKFQIKNSKIQKIQKKEEQSDRGPQSTCDRWSLAGQSKPSDQRSPIADHRVAGLHFSTYTLAMQKR
jgi:hypothetical protein